MIYRRMKGGPHVVGFYRFGTNAHFPNGDFVLLRKYDGYREGEIIESLYTEQFIAAIPGYEAIHEDPDLQLPPGI